MTPVLIIWAVATAIGMAAAAALDHWVKTRHPHRWEARTGLSRDRAEQLAETRRRAGVQTWRSR